MIHLGDITKISGYTAPIVDCVVGGSPCQDLSVAGKRAGLDGERSGLFMEQIRIIKEMREQDVRNGRTNESIRPRYMVWENVPGAFSSNKGQDFRIVLEETAKVADKDAVIPMPDKGKWQTSGCILGDGYSISWRVLDAQWWGVPQRRRRIALVADFNGYTAQQILFNAVEHNGSTESSGAISSVGNIGDKSRPQVQSVSKSVSRDTEPSQSQREATPADATRGIGADDIFCIDGDKLNKKERNGGSGIGYREGSQYTLTAKDVHGVAYSFEPGIASREGGHIYENVSGTLRANAGDNQMSAAYTMKIRSGVDVDAHGKSAGKGALIQTEKSGTLSCVQDQYLFQPVYSVENHPADSRVDIDDSGKVQTLTSRMETGGGNVPMVMESVIALDRASYNQGKNAQFDIGINENGTAQSLVAKGPGAVCYSLDPLSSNSMKSSNPHSGFHETDVARTIDTTTPDPSKNQGGVAVVETIGAFYPQMKAESNCFRTDGISNRLVNGTNPGFQNGLAIASVDCRNGTEDITNGALQSMASNNINSNNVVRTRYTVRRLTPLECERLQGYPDGWTDIGEYIDSNGKKKQSSDAARYKALGNSIALPPWKWVMKRLCACYERDATLASLFDGISGFPLIWTQLNGWGSVLWTSEIESFPIAVCKKHFGDDATGERGDFYEAILGRDTKTDVGER